MEEKSSKSVSPRIADISDTNQISETIALAFREDPTWGPLLGPTDDGIDIAVKYWRFFVRSVLRFPYTFMTSSAVAAWYPPEVEELTPDEQEQFEPFLNSLFGARRTAQLLATVEQFEPARPSTPHYYLSLLATHPDSRGNGHGMALLANSLEVIDALGMPSYLESSNPANDTRYERLGYRRHGTIELPSGDEITTMWRDPAPLPVD